MNRILSIGISLVLLLSIIVLSVIFITSNNTEDGAIMQEETALKVGRALLEERFPEIFLSDRVTVHAVENNTTWRAYIELEPTILEDGTRVSRGFGWLFYVEFRKRDGKVLRVGTYIGQETFRNAIAETETALEVGRALLEERFPEIFLIEGVTVNAVENRTTWTVYIVSDELKTLEDGSMDMYVEFRKRDGRILRFVPAN